MLPQIGSRSIMQRSQINNRQKFYTGRNELGEDGPSFDRNSNEGQGTGRTLFSRDKMEVNNYNAVKELSINPNLGPQSTMTSNDLQA